MFIHKKSASTKPVTTAVTQNPQTAWNNAMSGTSWNVPVMSGTSWYAPAGIPPALDVPLPEAKKKPKKIYRSIDAPWEGGV